MITNHAAAPLLSSLALAVAAQLSATCWISAMAPASLDRETASMLDPEVLAAAHEELVTARLASVTISRLGSRLYRLTAPSAT